MDSHQNSNLILVISNVLMSFQMMVCKEAIKYLKCREEDESSLALWQKRLRSLLESHPSLAQEKTRDMGASPSWFSQEEKEVEEEEEEEEGGHDSDGLDIPEELLEVMTSSGEEMEEDDEEEEVVGMQASVGVARGRSNRTALRRKSKVNLFIGRGYKNQRWVLS